MLKDKKEMTLEQQKYDEEKTRTNIAHADEIFQRITFYLSNEKIDIEIKFFLALVFRTLSKEVYQELIDTQEISDEATRNAVEVMQTGPTDFPILYKIHNQGNREAVASSLKKFFFYVLPVFSYGILKKEISEKKITIGTIQYKDIRCLFFNSFASIVFNKDPKLDNEVVSFIEHFYNTDSVLCITFLYSSLAQKIHPSNSAVCTKKFLLSLHDFHKKNKESYPHIQKFSLPKKQTSEADQSLGIVENSIDNIVAMILDAFFKSIPSEFFSQ